LQSVSQGPANLSIWQIFFIWGTVMGVDAHCSG
jgi:hypothetical protein